MTAPIPQQPIRFCDSGDGVKLAFTANGSGPALVRAPHWITHIERDGLFWSHLYGPLSERFWLYRFDQRGCGLSDRKPENISLEAWIGDLEAVVDAAGLERFGLLGISQGAATAIAYAARHPERVTHLILLGGYSRGIGLSGLDADQRKAYETFKQMVRVGWDGSNPFMRHAFTKLLLPDASADEAEAFNQLMQASTSSETAARIIEVATTLDVSAETPKVRCPTLVAHATRELSVPFDMGRRLASQIPGARLLALESSNHLLLKGEPALNALFQAIDEFIPGAATPAPLPQLTVRENTVLEYVAQGLDNAQIAARLSLSEKTVRNYLVTILDKLHAETRAQVIVRAREMGFGKLIR